jgi:hypothetical protein
LLEAGQAPRSTTNHTPIFSLTMGCYRRAPPPAARSNSLARPGQPQRRKQVPSQPRAHTHALLHLGSVLPEHSSLQNIISRALVVCYILPVLFLQRISVVEQFAHCSACNGLSFTVLATWVRYYNDTSISKSVSHCPTRFPQTSTNQVGNRILRVVWATSLAKKTNRNEREASTLG